MGFLFHQRQPEQLHRAEQHPWSAVGWMMDLFSVNGRTKWTRDRMGGCSGAIPPQVNLRRWKMGSTRLHTRCIRFDRDRDVSTAAVLDLGGVICNEGK